MFTPAGFTFSIWSLIYLLLLLYLIYQWWWRSCPFQQNWNGVSSLKSTIVVTGNDAPQPPPSMAAVILVQGQPAQRSFPGQP